MRAGRAGRAAMALLLVVLAHQHGAGAAARPSRNTASAVTVAPFRIEPQTLEGAEPGDGLERAVSRQSEAATARAERSMARSGLARAAGVVAPVHLSGVVRLPVTLPERLDHHRAQTRREPFVTVAVTLTGADGVVVARGDAMLRWKDLRWTEHHWRGGGRTRRLHHHDRPVDDVLEEAVTAAVDRAVNQAVDRAVKSLRATGNE